MRMAKGLQGLNVPIEKISALTGLSEDVIKKL